MPGSSLGQREPWLPAQQALQTNKLSKFILQPIYILKDQFALGSLREMSSPEEFAVIIGNLLKSIQNFSDDLPYFHDGSIGDYVDRTPSETVTNEHWR